jgi:transposase-like protein
MLAPPRDGGGGGGGAPPPNDDPVVRLATDERERLKLLERENRELRQANEILKKASAYFAQAALDRQSKT